MPRKTGRLCFGPWQEDLLPEPWDLTLGGLAWRTPLHGRGMAMLEADGLPKFLWVGGEGFDPFIVDIPPSTSGLDFRKVVTVEIKPILHLIIEDADGLRVANGLVGVKPKNEGPAARRSSGNIGATRRTDDLGEVKFTRNPGEYILIATKENGSCRLTRDFTFDGSAAARSVGPLLFLRSGRRGMKKTSPGLKRRGLTDEPRND